MTAKVTAGEWTPIPGSLPATVAEGTVYILPTREPASDGDPVPRYADTVRYLPRDARLAGSDGSIVFSLPENSRHYLQEFSAAEVWEIALAAAGIANAYLVLAVDLFIQHRMGSEGWTREQADGLPLKVHIAQIEDGFLVSKTLDIEGDGRDVLDALRMLTKGESPTGSPEIER